jgi:hypothetical protein
LPDEKVLLKHLNETRVKVAEVYGRVLDVEVVGQPGP